MKRYINGALLTALAFAMSFTSCKVDEGTEPNSSNSPDVTIYTYAPTSDDGEDLNPDNDVRVRFVANNATEDVYYILDEAASAAAEIEKDKDAYIQKVMNTGKRISNASSTVNDTIYTGILGPYVISAVAKRGTHTTLAQAEFTGYTWTTVVAGVYYFDIVGGKGSIPESIATEYQICDYDSTLYRYKNVLGQDKHLKITLTGKTGEENMTDDDGNTIKDENGRPVKVEYKCCRVAPQQSDYTYGSYGLASVRDIGYWQGNASYVDPDSGYNSFIYEDGQAALGLQWFVSAGNIGYGYDYFVPNDPANPEPTE